MSSVSLSRQSCKTWYRIIAPRHVILYPNLLMDLLEAIIIHAFQMDKMASHGEKTPKICFDF